jgi:hypothetical protein
MAPQHGASNPETEISSTWFDPGFVDEPEHRRPDQLQDLLDLVKDSDLCSIALGREPLDLDDLERARRLCTAAVEQDPDWDTPAVWLALVETQLGDPLTAAEVIDRSLDGCLRKSSLCSTMAEILMWRMGFAIPRAAQWYALALWASRNGSWRYSQAAAWMAVLFEIHGLDDLAQWMKKRTSIHPTEAAVEAVRDEFEYSVHKQAVKTMLLELGTTLRGSYDQGDVEPGRRDRAITSV